MSTIFLKFTDEAEAASTLGVEFDGRYASLEDGTFVDLVGTITKTSGTEEEPIVETLEGFHVNLATDTCPDHLTAYQVAPAAPYCVFA